MIKKIISSFLAILTLTQCSKAQNKNRIENINSIFDKMESQGIDTKKELLYGYFFFDKYKTKLESFSKQFATENYKVVSIEKAENNIYILHIEKVEIQSRESLLETELKFEKLAKESKIDSYDGWDVGNSDPTKPLIAKNDFEKSLENKTEIEIYNLGNEFYKEENNDKAIIAFEKCIEKKYKLDDCFYKLGVCNIGIGKEEVGIQYLEKSIELNPNNFKACFNIGAICYENKQFKKSIEFYQKAEKIDNKNDRVYYGIALSQFVLNDFKNAEINCSKALKISPNESDAEKLMNLIKEKL